MDSSSDVDLESTKPRSCEGIGCEKSKNASEYDETFT